MAHPSDDSGGDPHVLQPHPGPEVKEAGGGDAADEARDGARPEPEPTAAADASEIRSGIRARKFCPYCGVNLRSGSRKCRACKELLDDRYENIDEGTYRFVRLMVMTDIKHDVLHWLRNTVLLSSAIGIPLAYFGVPWLIQRVVHDKVDVAIDARIGEQLTTLQTEVDGMTVSAAAAISSLDALEVERVSLTSDVAEVWSRSEEILEATKNLNLIQVSQLRLHLEERLARLGNLQPVAPPSVHLVHPVTLVGERPQVLFERNAPLRLEWMDTLTGFDDPRYRLQVSSASGFDDPDRIAELLTPFTMEFVSPDEIAAQIAEPRLRGLYFWRVLRAGDEQPVSAVGCFEYYRSALERIAHTGEVRVGVSAVEAQPFLVRGTSGELGGFDADLARALIPRLAVAAQELRRGEGLPELRPSFRTFDWLPLLSAPAQGDVDLILSSITIKPEREGLYDIRFSQPYHRTWQALILPRQALAEVRSLDDLDALELAAQKGTSGERLVRKQPAGRAVLGIEGIHELLSWVRDQPRSPSADDKHWRGAILDQELATTLTLDYPGLGTIALNSLTTTAGEAVTPESLPEAFDAYGIAVASSESELLTGVNSILAILEERTLEELRAKHLRSQ